MGICYLNILKKCFLKLMIYYGKLKRVWNQTNLGSNSTLVWCPQMSYSADQVCTSNGNNDTCLEAPCCLLEVRHYKCLARGRSPLNDNHSSIHSIQGRQVFLITINKFVGIYKLYFSHLFTETLRVFNR